MVCIILYKLYTFYYLLPFIMCIGVWPEYISGIRCVLGALESQKRAFDPLDIASHDVCAGNKLGSFGKTAITRNC